MAQNPLLDIIRSSGSSARDGALAIANSTPLPEEVDVPYPQSDVVGALDSMDLTGDSPQDVAANEPAALPAPPPKGNPLMDIIRGNAPAAPALPKGNPLMAIIQANEAKAATQQAVAEATTPDDKLPVLNPDLANAIGVLDYRDPQEGQRRQQAAAVGEILNLPMFERVNLGAAPVNADGTVTIRRAQAVNPEAQAAAAAKLQADQAAAASRYKTEQVALNPSFFDKLQQRWRVGREQAVDDQLAYRAMMGEVDYEKVKNQLDPSTAPLKGGNWFSEGVLTAAQMLPAMVDGIVAGNDMGMKSAMAAGTTAFIAGQMGPQVATPEEILTVPAASSLGYAAGTAAGSSEYWYKQGAGSMYHQLRKEGVPHNVASTVAAGFGAPYAAIELAQVSKLVPGVSQSAAHAVAGGIKARLTALAKEKGVEYVEQIGQETAQELLSITGEKLAEWSAGVTPPKDKASAWERIASTIQQTATSIPFLMAPKGIVDTVQTVRGNEQTASAPSSAATATAAPVEVSQNFTPIATPAAAPATARPRSLGEVRAPQIAVDQAAIDEAFGSPFAPPLATPAEDSTFAPPANGIPPEASTRLASATIAPEVTGSHELATGEGGSVSTQQTPIAVSTDWISSFTEKPQAQQAAREWWRTNRPEPVEVSHPKFETPIVISWQGVKHATRNSAGMEELATVPFIQEAIANSEWVGQAPDKRQRNTIKAVHELKVPILLNNEPKDLRIVVRQTTSGTLFYDHSYIKTTEPAVTSDEPGLQDSGQQAAGSDTKNNQSSLDVNQPDLKNTESEFETAMRNAMRQNQQGGFIDTKVIQDFGRSVYQTGKNFAQWSGEMVRKFGETIRDVLETIWEHVSGGQYLPQARERGSVNISPGTGPKPRRFTQSVQAAEGVRPEVKAHLSAFEYDPVSNPETVADARARIDAAGNLDAAFTGLMGQTAVAGWQPTAVDYATGMELMSQLQNRGRYEDAGAIANMMATRATDQGRAIQALSMISRLGPQGIEVFAQRQLTQAATSGKTEKQRTAIQTKIDEADQLRGEVGKVRHGAATAAIVGNKDLIKGELPAGVDPVKVNLAIRDAIMGSPTPLAAEAATHKILTAEGLSDKGAVRISKSIVKDFLKTSQDARAKVLQDLQAAAENDRRLDKSKLGALMRLNREGKLTDASLHAGMAKMLGIPHWGAEQSAKVQRILAQRDRATDPRIKLVKAAEALDVVYREFMPPGLLAKIDTFQTLSMLLNTKTVTRNVLGNTLMFAGDLAADTAAVPMDAITGLGTGQRTRTGLSLGERLVGLGAGVGDVQAGYRFARSEGKGVLPSLAEGVDTLVRLGRLQSSGKYDSAQIGAYSGGTFTAPVLRHLEATLGAVLSVADRGFYESAFRSSLDNRMKAARANGTPMLAPDADMITAARMDAARAVYQDDNAASRTLGGIRRVLNANQRWGLGSMLFKFTQVPGSILTRAIEFSPLGFIGNAYEGIAPLLSKSKDFDQKAFVDSFTRALVGTTGLVATGYWLAQLGIISAGSDAKDEDKRNLDKARGWGNYRLNVDALKRALMTGNFWTRQKQQKSDMVVSYDWAQPLSIGVAMGAYARENQDAVREDILRGKRQSLLATGMNWLAYGAGAATGAMNSLVEQPLLTGINSFMRNAGYDGLIGAVIKTAADIPGSFIPSSARQWMQLDDNAARETRDSSPFRQYVNELKAQLPGLSKTLPQKYDIAGQPVERWAQDSNTIFNVLFNPGMVTYIKGSPVLTEMGEIYRRTADRGAIANQVKPEFTLEGVKVRLTDEEISAMQKDMGALSVAAIEKYVLDDPRYAKATWDIKAKAFTRALEKAATAAKYRILLSRPDLTARAKQEFFNARAAKAAAENEMALME